MAQPSGGDAQSEAMSSMMMPMLVLLLVMMVLMFIPGLRVILADSAGLAIEPLLPFHEQYFVPTVFIVGTSIMVVNTIIRSFFIDPIKQAHFSHRQRQVGKQLREAQMARDTARVEKMQKLQMEMMPENMAMQSAMMRPMMFTIVFIIAIFSWMASEVETFRVSFVSLPWLPMWSFNERILWIFPAWIATYITMSAPFSRIIDRHLKILRYKSHPAVLAADPLPEPLLHLIKDEKSSKSSRERRTRRAQRSRAGPRKRASQEDNSKPKGGNTHTSAPRVGTTCPSCSTDMISRSQSGRLRCDVCRHEWR
ncbi:MAG: hypothetical protein CMA93_04045 [Euryarchaeota archaeon]|nr:hypothetical protein [Euryarchaeota archaeon]|tara:strand:+ start:231 stop:1157 length:927 start_codon:yes stop_codon:yes gene_type:complete